MKDRNRALSEVVEENSILCTDKHRSYIPFATQHNFELHQIRDGRKTVDIYNIQRVNVLLKGGDLLPIVLFFIPLLLVVISFGIYFINKSIISAKNFFYCYCILLMVVEVIVFIFMSDVQFIPPSLSFSWFQGTFIFIVVSLIYIFCKIPFK